MKGVIMRITLLFIGLWLTFIVQCYGQMTIVLQPGPIDGKDSYVNSVIPDEPGGDKNELVACGWTFGGFFGIGRSLMRFDFSQVPVGAQILDAKLTLYFNENSTFGAQTGANASYLEKITEDWDESTTTWNTMPSSTMLDAVFIPQTIYPSQDITDIDLTGFVSGWIQDPSTNFGMIHRLQTEIEYNCVVYHSSDYTVPSKRPKLVVTYYCDPPVAAFGTNIQIPVVTFTDSSLHAYNWLWDFGDGSFSTIQNPVHAYVLNGIYQVCLRVQDSCGYDSICKPVHVCSFPDPHFTFIKDESMVSFSDSSFQPISWYWDFGDGFYSDLKNPQHYFNKSGTYNVCETVTNACGDQTYCDSVTVIVASVNEKTNGNYPDVSPNPAHDNIMVSVRVKKEGIINIDLYNPQIIKMYSFIREIIPGDNKFQLNIPGLPAGLYFLRTEFGENENFIKLIIQ
jgi:PKD repeat protein